MNRLNGFDRGSAIRLEDAAHASTMRAVETLRDAIHRLRSARVDLLDHASDLADRLAEVEAYAERVEGDAHQRALMHRRTARALRGFET